MANRVNDKQIEVKKCPVCAETVTYTKGKDQEAYCGSEKCPFS